MSHRFVFALGILMSCAVGCAALEDIARQVKDHNGNAGGGTSSSDAGTAPAPTGAACAATSSCPAGSICTVENGVCNSPPGCDSPGKVCPAVCYGTCEPKGTGESACGPKVCPAGLLCCNASCGVCAPPGVACTQQACEPTTTPPPQKCETLTQGSATACADTGTWKQKASDACTNAKLVLTDYKVYEDCGNGSSRYVSFVCCQPASPPPPAPGSCTTDADCRLVSDYCKGCDCRALASDEKPPTCDTAGVQCLVDPCLNRAAVCQGGKCAAVSTAPPTCEKRTQGGPTSCKPVATWKQYASEDCIASGLNLTEYGVSEDCGGGNSRYVNYVCCSK